VSNKLTFKSTFQIIDELSQIRGELTDKAWADITRLVAGLRNAQGFNALVTNFQDARDSMLHFETAAGDADAKFKVYSDSIQFKSQQLKASFQALAASLIDSAWIKGITDLSIAVTKALGSFDAIVPKTGAVVIGIAAISSALKSFKNSNFGNQFSQFFTGLAKPKIDRVSVLIALKTLAVAS
jgi:hypothetical protein